VGRDKEPQASRPPGCRTRRRKRKTTKRKKWLFALFTEKGFISKRKNIKETTPLSFRNKQGGTDSAARADITQVRKEKDEREGSMGKGEEKGNLS